MKWHIIFLILSLFSIVVSADYQGYYMVSSNIDLKIPCIDTNNAPCNINAYCNITINYPNGTNIVNNQPMTNDLTYFNYTLPDSSTLGLYSYCMYCTSNITNGYGCSYFEINNFGSKDKPIMIGIYVTLIILSALFFYLALSLRKVHPWVNVFLLLNGFAHILAVIFIAYLDYINHIGTAPILMAIFIIDSLTVLMLVYMYLLQKIEEDVEVAINDEIDNER